jgi:hypothetical protein
MAVAFDAFSTASTVDPNFTHTPVGTPRGILMLLLRVASEAVNSATYGGVSFGSPVASFTNTVGGEGAGLALDVYFIGSSVPTGAQTVAVDGGANGNTCWVYSVTATGDVEFINSAQIESTSQANPSTTLALSGRTCFVAQCFLSGQDTVGGLTPFANWNSRNEADNGTLVIGSYSYDVIDSSNVTVGLTQTAEDINLLAAAISEIVAGPQPQLPRFSSKRLRAAAFAPGSPRRRF